VVDRVHTTISRYNMLAPADRVVAAVSGGPDSVCLFLALREVATRIGFTLTGIAHVNHKLRAEESDADERFVRQCAEQWNVRFYSAALSVADVRGNLEQAAREARYHFFKELLSGGACNKIATGHTRDDQAETVLFRLLRGSGLTGLAGIHPLTDEGLVRPLIGVTRTDVLQFLGQHNQPWREDSTNQQDRFARNRIRAGLLPHLKREWNPRVSESLANLADLCWEEESFWDQQVPETASNLLFEKSFGVEGNASGLAALPRALGRRLIRYALKRTRSNLRSIEFDHIEAVLDLARGEKGTGRLVLPGVMVRRSFDWIQFSVPGESPALESITIDSPGTYGWPGRDEHVCVEVTERKRPEEPRDGYATLKGTLNGKSGGDPLILRGWRAGDNYRPLGRTRNEKVAEMFQAARVPSWYRSTWPILVKGHKILWARQFGVAEEFESGSGAGPVMRIREVSKSTSR